MGKNEEPIVDLGERYMLCKGRIGAKGKYKIGNPMVFSNTFEDARRWAYALFREREENVLIIDRKVNAIVGNLWMLTEEIAQ